MLDGMARCIENLAPQEVLVSVLLADADGRHLRHGAAPSLPDFYNQAIDGIATGEGVGSCGTAAHRREPVIVTDIATDPFWADFRDLAERAGLAACWSTPILARDGSLLGTFAMYHRTPRVPRDTDLALARVFTGTAALAIERHHIEQAKADADARARAAHDELARVVQAERELRAEAEQRAAAAAELTARLRAAAAAQAATPAPIGVSSAEATAAPHPPRSRSLTRGATRRGAARSTSRRQSSTCVRSSSPTRNSAAGRPLRQPLTTRPRPAAPSRDRCARGRHPRATV
ncbi:GAF domain-containing protein [Micromonospora sp. BRA006-A]|nr:GAF domain-containing protein [Micromonospora sp. BRA006-A]